MTISAEFIAKECFWQIQERMGQQLETPRIERIPIGGTCSAFGPSLRVMVQLNRMQITAENPRNTAMVIMGGADRFLDQAIFSKRFLEPAAAVLANCLGSVT